MASSTQRGADPATSTAKRKKKQSRKVLLSSTRPRHLRSTDSTLLPSSAGRALISTHHTLHKNLTSALRTGDGTSANTLRAEIEALGGLSRYQDASLAGQSKERGGDTSGVLVSWLSSIKGKHASLRMLEVGALSVENACARSGLFKGGIERIDLQSRHPEIMTQDFMQRPLPEKQEEKLDVVSLSLVVNFVGDLQGRGEMLRRVKLFLRRVDGLDGNGRQGQEGDAAPVAGGEEGIEEEEPLLPALFLVLPASCVTNSRYMDEERLEAIMQKLGYTMVRRKLSAKLAYYLWRYNGAGESESQMKGKAIFGKEALKRGRTRNNFAIVLK